MTLVGKEFSHYRILRLVGRGGMGEVYLSEDIRVQRQVAAKFIRMERVESDQRTQANALRLFWREATAIARLDHPTILPLYDHGEAVIDDTSVAYLIMPYRPEGSLVAWLHTFAPMRQNHHLTIKQIIHVIRQAGQSLQYAHDHQIMHLDVKPANFLIRSRSVADDSPDLLLSDFGIARLANATSNASQQVRGTPTYMAPEQWASTPTFASDQYALAIMAYELLTDSPPFQGAPMNVMYAHLQEHPPSVRDRNPLLPSTVDEVLNRALAKKPEERFPSIAEFAQAFEDAFQSLDEATALRMLPLSPATPPQVPGTPTPARDIWTTLAISAEEASSGTVRALTLANGRTISIQIPPDAHSGQVLILIGQGHTLDQNTPAGNLYLTLVVVEAPMPVVSLGDDMTPSTRSSQPAQTPSSPLVEAPVQEKKSTPPPVVLPRTALSPQHDSELRSVSAAPQPIHALRDTMTFSLPARTKHRRVSPVHLILILLALILLGGASLGIYRAVTTQQPPPTPLNQHATLTPSNQHATPTPPNQHATPTSPPGSTWTVHSSGTSQHLYDAAWSGSLFVTVGSHGALLTSPDGSTWTPRTSGTQQDLWDVAWSGSLFVAVGHNGTILTSPDGSTWTPRNAGIPQDLWNVAWSGSLFVAVGHNGIILTSPDGSTWTVHPSGTSQDLVGVTWSGSLFMAVGHNGTILTSLDGSIWAPQTSGTSQHLWDVAWSGSQFVAVESNGTIITSPDGSTWTVHPSSTSQTLSGVAWSGSQGVAVGHNGIILTSPDGNTWTSHPSGTSQHLWDVAWSGSHFVAVGDNGTILTSP
ncbi:MAG: protein kinase [Chloroflexota bacterium]|nr:protein kinase [Chloroflexota bacterium]